MNKKVIFLTTLVGGLLTLSGCVFSSNPPDRTVPLKPVVPPPVVSVTPPVSVSSTLGEPAIRTPSSLHYSFEFPLNFSSVTNTFYRDYFTSEHIAARFPTSSVIGISETTIDVGLGDQWCQPGLVWVGNEIATSTRMLDGVVFQKASFEDAAAGNQYRTTVYFTQKENRCYALVLFVHTSTPENYADTEAQAKQYRAAQDAGLKKINDMFERIAGTFHFVENK